MTTQAELAQSYLGGLHTRQLLKLRDKAYAVSNIGLDLGQTAYVDVDSRLSVSIHQIRDELSKREHVPNTQEARVIRQQRAKEKKNR